MKIRHSARLGLALACAALLAAGCASVDTVKDATFPPDWAGLLFGDIEQELAALRTPR